MSGDTGDLTEGSSPWFGRGEEKDGRFKGYKAYDVVWS